MSLTVIGWLFTCGVLAHNAEEAAYLPAWSVRAGRFHRPVSAPVFRRAAVLLSMLFVAITAGASMAPAGFAAYLMAGYVLAMVLNVFVPHVAASVLTWRYMPGTLTALALNLPLGIWYLARAFAERRIEWPTFYWAGPAVVVGLLMLLPALLAAGRRLQGRNANANSSAPQRQREP